MRDKLDVILLALGFAVAGSGGTALGFLLARPAGPDLSAGLATTAGVDTATTGPGPAAKARSPRGPAAGRAKGKGRGRAGGPPGNARSASGPGRGQRGSWAALAEGLDITPEQQQAWQQMMDTIRGTCVATRLERGDTTLELMLAAVSEAEADPTALHAQVEGTLEAQREASHCVLDQALAFREVLTPEQREALASRAGQLEKRRQAWMDSWSK